MKGIFKAILLTFVLLGSSLSAVLPPAAQSKREMEAILNSPEINELIPSGDVIEQLSRISGGYLLITNKRIIAITVHYSKEKRIGPVRFRLEFHEPIVMDSKGSWRE